MEDYTKEKIEKFNKSVEEGCETIMKITRSLGISDEQQSEIIKAIVNVKMDSEWKGWEQGYAKGHERGKS